MNFIKLSMRKSGKAVYIADDKISCLIRQNDSSSTDVYLQGDLSPVPVRETPEQIISLLLD